MDYVGEAADCSRVFVVDLNRYESEDIGEGDLDDASR